MFYSICSFNSGAILNLYYYYLSHANLIGELFFKITHSTRDAHSTHAHPPLWTHVRRPYPMSTFEELNTIFEVTIGVSLSTRTPLIPLNMYHQLILRKS
jgi:hypothetical protein